MSHDAELYDHGVLAVLALSNGWEAGKTSLFDEEGVDGWRWTSPDGTEYTCIGVHEEPPVLDDDALLEAVMEHLSGLGLLGQARIESPSISGKTGS